MPIPLPFTRTQASADQQAPGSILTPTPVTRWVADLAIMLLGLAVVAMDGSLGGNGLVALAGIVQLLSVALRRQAPLLMLSLVSVCSLIIVALSDAPTTPVLAVPLVAYSVARWVPSHAARAVLVVGAVGSVLAGLRWGRLFSSYGSNTSGAGLIALVGIFCFALVVTPYALGRRVLASAQLREQRIAVDAERETHNLAEREQQLRIAEATARAQIARELHDIVAHSLSVIIVQAEGGKALATKKPDAAAQVLGTIAETGREALGEMRRIVSVLRDGPAAEPEYAPTPGLDDIADLVARSGAKVHYDVVGQVPFVPQTLGLTAYRIVQEALTNVLRHAGPDATAQVLLSCSPHLVVVEVVDNGRGAASTSTSDGQGNGLRGMTERVEAMGGQLVARPRSGGGFLVRALLPIVGTPVTNPVSSAAPTFAPTVTVAGAPVRGTGAVPGREGPESPQPSAMATRPLPPQPQPGGMGRAGSDGTRTDQDRERTRWLPTPEVTHQLPGAPEPTRPFPASDPTQHVPDWMPPTGPHEPTRTLPSTPPESWRGPRYDDPFDPTRGTRR